MANWSNPVLTSTYTNFVTEVKDRDIDLALMFDGVSPTNIPTGAIRWNSSVNRWQKWSGSAWAELTSTYALTTITSTGSITGTALIPTGLSVPVNGVFLPSTNAIGFATNSTARAFIDSQGRFLLGTSAILSSPPGSSTSLLQIRSTGDDAALISGDNTTGMTIAGYLTGSAIKAVLNLNGARGSLASPTAISTNDFISGVNFRGWTGSGFGAGAAIQASAEGGFTASSLPTRISFFTAPSGSTTPVERFRIASNGNLWIGQTATATPGYNNTTVGIGAEGTVGTLFLSRAEQFEILSVNSNFASGTANHISIRRSGSEVGSITSTPTSTSYNTSSDYRLKENVVAMANAIDRVKSLSPYRFNFIAAPGSTVDGFFAHEVQGIVPEAVTGYQDQVDESENPVYQSIDQSKLVPLLTGALKEAIAKIEELEARIEVLEAA